MNMLPGDVMNNIMFLNRHPIADIMKASTIFEDLQIREISIVNNQQYPLEHASSAFDIGCDDGWDNDQNAKCILALAIQSRIEWDEVEDCVNCYDIAFYAYIV